jgi:hypothetical protein
MTDTLAEALKAYRHLRGPLVLYRDDAGGLLTARTQRYWLGKAQRLANLPDKGAAHAEAHVLLAPGDAGRSDEGDPGARRTLGPDHDTAVHAPVSGDARRVDPFAGSAPYGRRMGEAVRHLANLVTYGVMFDDDREVNKGRGCVPRVARRRER